ncbi:LytTR family DNA-binding domain-containing protein [Saprospiraceae bacterium]|nr:LytTR family DNA-binding domain-containing protein [Saprospiraceae bacterium]
MIDYIIVDDEPLARDGMELNCNQVTYLNHCGTFENAMQAHGYINEHHVDLIFLDIEMPGITGLEFIKTLVTKPQIILTTAYPQYALESYELDVTDYLVKPIRFERFLKAVNKANEYINLQKEPSSVIDNYEETFMYIKSDRQYVKVYYEDVLFVKGMKDYVLIHTTGDKYMTAMNIKTILAQLPKELFARISKSYIVQIKQIAKVGNDAIFLSNDDEISLGPSYKEDFVNKYVLTNLVKR